MPNRILSIFLPLVAICLLSGCNSNSAEQTASAPPPAAQPVSDAPSTEDIPPVDPVWDLMAKQQAHLDKVEKTRTAIQTPSPARKSGPVRSIA